MVLYSNLFTLSVFVPCRRKLRYSSSSSKKGGTSERDPMPSNSRHEQEDLSLRGHRSDSPPPRHLGKVSSSECNSSDELTNPLSEQEDSAYRSSTSETALAESPRPPYVPATQLPSPRQESPLATPPIRAKHAAAAARQGEGRTPPFRPRLLQEPSQTSPRPLTRSAPASASTSVSHRRTEPGGTRTPSSDVSSKSGSDQERSDGGAGEGEERGRGSERSSSGGGSGGPQGTGVTLTTYFSVDNCMTDMYRLKYHHQRPLLLSVAEPRPVGRGGGEHREVGHPNETQGASEPSRSRADLG